MNMLAQLRLHNQVALWQMSHKLWNLKSEWFLVSESVCPDHMAS